MPSPQLIQVRRTNEELFFDHYPQILGWASQLTRLERADTDDLVQDFFIQVIHSNASLAEVDEIKPYLFKILRNLYYSHLRRKGRSPISNLSIVDYDSMERGIVGIDGSSLLVVRTDLRRICDFACQRKKTSQAASIFILRFFLGYHSSEVMKVVQVSRMGVDRSLQIARREAQLYLDKPVEARSSTPRDRYGVSGVPLDETHALFLDLHHAIFSSSEGSCIAPVVLQKHYQGESSRRFTVHELAHLVSCRSCLDRVNTILGLPLLDERSPDDSIGRDQGSGPGGSGGLKLSVGRGPKRVAGEKERGVLNRRVREVFEHRPGGLEITLNGDMRSSQSVTAEISEFYLKLSRVEIQDFIEVFSEQGVRLCYLPVVEPTLSPTLEQHHTVALSDGRSLKLALSFANDLPTVHVVYRDPVFAQIADVEDESEPSVASVVSVQQFESRAIEDASFSAPRVKLLLRYWVFVKNKLSETALPDMNPFLLSALILASASMICLFLWLRGGSVINATTFLDRAQISGTALGTQPGVIYQKIRIKTPERMAESTLYRDLQHRRHIRESALDANDAGLRMRLIAAGVDWNDPLSAGAYRKWHDHESVSNDSVKRTGSDQLTLTTAIGHGAVISESLTVRQSDFHAVGKTIELRDYGTIEIAELNYDVLPWNAVNQDWFEPLAVIRPDVLATHASLLPRLPVRPGQSELDETELEARLALSRLHADASERLEIARGLLEIDINGVVETEARKQEIEREIRQIPHAVSAIHTFEEAEAQPAIGSEVTSVKQSSVLAEPSPLEEELLNKGESRDEVSQVYQQFFSASVAVNRNSNAVSELLRRFDLGEDLTDAGRTVLEQLIVQDKAGLLGALQQQEAVLRQLGVGSEDSTDAPVSARAGDALRAAAAHNVALCNELITSSGQARDSGAITAELSDSIAQLRILISRIPDPQPPTHTHASASSTTSKNR